MSRASIAPGKPAQVHQNLIAGLYIAPLNGRIFNCIGRVLCLRNTAPNFGWLALFNFFRGQLK
jgi:hypothetical protein